jgi:hypothetical protein
MRDLVAGRILTEDTEVPRVQLLRLFQTCQRQFRRLLSRCTPIAQNGSFFSCILTLGFFDLHWEKTDVARAFPEGEKRYLLFHNVRSILPQPSRYLTRKAVFFRRPGCDKTLANISTDFLIVFSHGISWRIRVLEFRTIAGLLPAANEIFQPLYADCLLAMLSHSKAASSKAGFSFFSETAWNTRRRVLFGLSCFDHTPVSVGVK